MSTEHERAGALLPWYVNATLSKKETALVEEHLGSCLACRQEVARYQDLAAATRSAGAGEDWSPSPAHFARVMARALASERRAPPFWQRVVSWARDTPRPVRFAFALQGAAALALLGVVLLRPPRLYETLSRPEAAVTVQRARLHVVFAPDLSESGLRQILQGIQGEIVGGPSPTGVYTIELAFPASERERAAQIAAHLAADPKVRFAAPVAG